MDRPEAVLITPAMPAAAGNGLAMRAGLLLEGLARSFTVKVLVVRVFEGMGAPSELVQRLAEQTLVLDLDRASDARADVIERLQLRGGPERIEAVHPLPTLSRGMTARVAKRVAAECSRAAMVLVLRSYLLPLLDVVLGDASRPKLVLDVDDIESVVHRELGQADEAARFERLETHYLPLMDEVFVCSRGDAGVVSHAHVIPNAVRPPEIAAPADSTDFDLLLVGNLSYAPNVEAAGWLCHEVLPHMTGATVAILGSSPPPSVMRLADEPAITVVPDPQNVAPWYERSAVAVVPVKRGGGSRIKLIEALAHGRPVVATSTGAAGLPWSQVESPVVIADTPSDFAQACRELIDDRERARSLGDEGRKLVLARASVDVVAAQIDRLLGSTG